MNEGANEFCSFCDSRLKLKNEIPPTKDVSLLEASLPRPRSEGALALSAEPAAARSGADWRGEVASRLEAYRARKRKERPDDLQAALAFEAEAETPLEEETTWPADDAAPVEERVERMEIDITQPSEMAEEAQPKTTWQLDECPSEAALRPVADLGERQRAGMLDGAFLLLAYGAFLGVFKAFGGEFKFGRLDAMVHVAALVVFYMQYFTLFTVLGRGTPGMLIRGLEVVSFDGGAPTRTQLVWRSFGYLVSAATAFLGFFWALWDEDRLTWQDRISQTYISPLAGNEYRVDREG